MPTELLTDEEKMRRVPGIHFANSPTGRVARINGTGIKVWMVIRTFRDDGWDWARLREAYHWLSEEQLRAALNYYREFPDEIDARIALDDSFDIEEFWREHPYAKPPWA